MSSRSCPGARRSGYQQAFHAFTGALACDPAVAYLRQQLLLVRLDPETVGGSSGGARRVAELPHAADLSHHGTLLLLLLLLALPPFSLPGLGNRTRNLQLILFICRKYRIQIMG